MKYSIITTLSFTILVLANSLAIVEGCEDAEGSYEGKDCTWVAQLPDIRCGYCIGTICAVDYCLQTCNSCPTTSPTESPTKSPTKIPTEAGAVKLTASDGSSGDWFGFSVAVSNITTVVGAYKDDVSGLDSGSVYVFTQNEELNEYEEQKLTASDGASFDHFGRSVAVSDDTIVVSAYRDDDGFSNSGSVYVFTQNGVENWYQQQKLTASDGGYDDNFGSSVAVSGTIIVVGAYMDDDRGSGSGSVYVFTQNEVGSWYQQQKLTASDGESNDYFGYSVAVFDRTMVVGAYGSDVDDSVSGGSVYVFTQNEGNWYEEQNLTPSDGVTAEFGKCVALSSETIVVGSKFWQGADGLQTGAAYVYTRSEEGNWYEQQKLTASDGELWDYFGISVAVSDTTIVVGAYIVSERGAAYVFTEDGEGNWYEQETLTASDGMWSDWFGISVAVSNTQIVVGAYQDDNRGAVYIY